jgi:uncharacterized protein (UPF0128 family)
MQQFEYIQIYDHEADLLTRITRDMGKYYSTQGELQQTDNNLEMARRFDQCQENVFFNMRKWTILVKNISIISIFFI